MVFVANALDKLSDNAFVTLGTENKFATVFVFVVWAGTICTNICICVVIWIL